MNNPNDKGTSDDLQALAADVARLSRLLTSGREGMPAAYLKDAGLRKAYLSYFLPSNQPKIQKPLKELQQHPKGLFAHNTIRVLDIGSGPGTAALGVLDFFSQAEKKPSLAFTLLDQVAENLREAEMLFSARRGSYAPGFSLQIVRSDTGGIERHVQGRFDLVILSNVLNELFVRDEQRIEQRAVFLKKLLDQFLDESGSCIIIEPALRETSRDLLSVRDKVLVHGVTVYSPCLSGGNCHALDNPKDWCHEEDPWNPPAIIEEIDRLTGLRKDALKYSYLVLRKDGLSLSDLHGRHAFRVVSEPLISKGKAEFYLCGSGVRKLITRQDKDATPANERFGQLKRGDVVCFEGLLDEGKRFKVCKDTKVVPPQHLR